MEAAVKFSKRVVVCTALCGMVKIFYPKVLEFIFNPQLPKPDNGLFELTDQNFYRHIESGDHFVKFYAPWCGHCQRLAPTWSELAKDLEADPLVSIGKLDCTQAESICRDIGVKGYPTLQYFRDGQKVEHYSGARVLQELKGFVNKHKQRPEPAEAPTLTSTQEFQDAIQSSALTFIIFGQDSCTDCLKYESKFDDLATLYSEQENVNVFKVDCTPDDMKSLCESQKIEKFPWMVMYQDGKQKEVFSQSRTMQNLLKFIHKHRIEHSKENGGQQRVEL